MDQSNNPITINPQVLMELVTVRMPFGKYKDRLLCDLPGPYLLWFYRKGFPREDWVYYWLYSMKSN